MKIIKKVDTSYGFNLDLLTMLYFSHVSHPMRSGLVEIKQLFKTCLPTLDITYKVLLWPFRKAFHHQFGLDIAKFG